VRKLDPQIMRAPMAVSPDRAALHGLDDEDREVSQRQHRADPTAAIHHVPGLRGQ
jgi:hypothetical protein